VFDVFTYTRAEMLIKTSYKDVPTKADGKSGTMRIYVIEPNMPDYPEAKFPGVVVVRLGQYSGMDEALKCSSPRSIR
jgi:hypothetical protein